MDGNTRLVVIGFDALDQRLVRQWAAEGHLPTFASLFERSAWGLIENQPLLEAGSAWATFVRGISVARHGQIDGRRLFNPETYDFDGDPTEDHFGGRTIWHRLSDAGRRVAVVDVPYMSISGQLNGVQVDAWLDHAGRSPSRLIARTHPPEFGAEISARFGDDPLGGHDCDVIAPTTRRGFVEFRDQLIERGRMKTELALDLLEREPWDFMLVNYADAHCAGHHLWNLHDTGLPDHDPDVARQLGNPLRDVYQNLDAQVARLLAEIDDDTTVIVFASHGMERNITGTMLLDKVLVRLDGGAEVDKARGAVGVLRTIWQRLPPAGRKRLDPIRRRIWRSGVGSSFQGNRERRRFFEVHANAATGGVRINLAGRERDGLVQPGAEYDALVDELIADLSEIVNDDTGAPAASRVVATRDVYPTGERLDNLPDVLVQWNRSAGGGVIRQVSSPTIGTVVHDHGPRTGDHGPSKGMFLAVGPGIVPGHRPDDVSATDLAPTIAALLGAPLDDFDGTPIEEIMGRSVGADG